MLIEKNKIKCIYSMKSYEHEVCIANTLKYIHLLPKKEEDNEINAILKKYKGINRKNDHNHTYIKLIKKIFWLAGKVPQ